VKSNPQADRTLIYMLTRERWRWITLLLILAIIGGAWTWMSRIPASESTTGLPPASPRKNFLAPDFTLELLGGGQVTLSDLRGKVVVLNFWATWCPSCRDEMPAIERIYQAYKHLGVEVLAVNATDQDSQADVSAFIEEHNLTFPVPLDRTGAVNDRYLLQGLPSTYFIDRSGMIQSVVVGGPMGEALIQSKIEEMLKETP
jgi:peroxiredoxin